MLVECLGVAMRWESDRGLVGWETQTRSLVCIVTYRSGIEVEWIARACKMSCKNQADQVEDGHPLLEMNQHSTRPLSQLSRSQRSGSINSYTTAPECISPSGASENDEYDIASQHYTCIAPQNSQVDRDRSRPSTMEIVRAWMSLLGTDVTSTAVEPSSNLATKEEDQDEEKWQPDIVKH